MQIFITYGITWFDFYTIFIYHNILLLNMKLNNMHVKGPYRLLIKSCKNITFFKLTHTFTEKMTVN